MAEPRDYRQADLFRPALEAIIDMRHPLVRLAGRIDWGFLDRRFGEVYAAGDGQPPLPVRLIAGLFILKPMHSLSDESLCARFLENPLYQAPVVNDLLPSAAPDVGLGPRLELREQRQAR